MANKKLKVGNVPNLRFPGFEGKWERTSVEENCLLKGRIGYRGYTTGDLVEKGKGAFVLGGKHIKNQTIDLSEPTFLSWDKYYESPEIMVKVGDIIFSQRGTLGDCAIIEKEIGYATINPSMVLLKDITCNPKFLYYILIGENIQKEVQKNKALGAIPMLSQKQIKAFSFLIPKNPNEQQKISDFLSLIDERIQTQNKIIEQLETLIKGLCQELILVQTSNVKLKDCVSCYSSSLTESDLKDKNGTFPVYGATGIISFTENYQINEDAILIIKDGSGVGKVQYGTGKFSVIGTLNYLIAKKEINLRYILFCLKFFNFGKYKVGSGIPHIYFKDYGEASIYCPSLQEQNETERLLSFIDKKINIEKILLLKYEIQKKHLLQNLFI